MVVEECIEFLRTNFNAEMSEETLREENVHFNLPKELFDLTVPEKK